MTSVLLPERIARAVRDTTPADNAGLVELARSCPMRGDITMCVERAPDFFARWTADCSGTRSPSRAIFRRCRLAMP